MNSKGRLLVVDETPRNVELIAVRLRQCGYEVIEAYDGERALAAASWQSPDLVLTGVNLGQVNGLELTRRLKARPEWGRRPVILMTTQESIEDKKNGLAAGTDEFLSTPVNLLELEQRVQAQVRTYRLQEELATRNELMNSLVPVDADKQGCVFVLEDDELLRKLLEEEIRQCGHEVVGASGVEQGLDAALAARPDVMVIDLVLPDGNGLDFLEHYHRASKQPIKPAIMVITGLKGVQLKLDCLHHGVDDYLTKPLVMDEVMARLAAQMRNVKSRHAVRKQLSTSQRYAITDSLTGLFNRSYLDLDLAGRVDRAHGGNSGFSLCVLGVDQIKQINDQYGHQTGDRVLRELAEIIRSAARQYDLVCRYGDEEFVMVLPATPPSDAAMVAERLRNRIAEHGFAELAPGVVTASIGVTSWGQTDSQPDAIFDRADQAMHQAKVAGRNRVANG